MPKNVMRFERFMYLSVLIELISTALDRGTTTISKHAIGMVALSTAFFLGSFVLCIWLAARRRKNWARWAFFCVFVIGLPSAIWSILE